MPRALILANLTRESPGGNDVTAFCLGAFRDALWLRRHALLPRSYGSLLIDVRQSFPDPAPSADSRFLESPIRCLAFLALLVAMNLAIAVFCRQHVIFSPVHADARTLAALAAYQGDHPQRSLLLNLLTLFAVAWLIVPATTSLSLGDYPRNPNWFRRWVFFTLKIAFILPIAILADLNLASIGSSISPVGMQAGLWVGVMALRWALLDQRRRCPVCLRLLANPCASGNPLDHFSNGTALNSYASEDTGCCTFLRVRPSDLASSAGSISIPPGVDRFERLGPSVPLKNNLYNRSLRSRLGKGPILSRARKQAALIHTKSGDRINGCSTASWKKCSAGSETIAMPANATTHAAGSMKLNPNNIDRSVLASAKPMGKPIARPITVSQALSRTTIRST